MSPRARSPMIVPWNFPLLLPAQKLPFALAAGCTAVVKPSEYKSSSTLEVARIAEAAGVRGCDRRRQRCGPDAGAPLARSRDVDVHSFAGSTATGRRITQASAGSVKRRRLGGKSASVVFDDADLDAALDGVLLGVFCNNGDANSTEYGLAGSIWTNNIDKALPVAREMRSGRFWINTTIDGAPQLPAGGMNQSGLGREMGQAGFEEFTEPKTIQFAAS